ncbi:hypothetical protein N9O71_01825 [bacterium]|nr:hypothetical protein [bacterium]
MTIIDQYFSTCNDCGNDWTSYVGMSTNTFGMNTAEAESYAEYSARRGRWAEHVEGQEAYRQEDKARRLAEHATSQLYKCVLRGDVAAVKSMLAKGADADAVVAKHGPLEAIARAYGRGKMVEYLNTT